MKRLLLLVIGACMTCLAFGLVSAAPVAPGGDPAPGLDARSWACYGTCVLPVDLVIADYNATPDGWPDIAVLCSATGQVDYFLNKALGGPGVFYDAHRLPANGTTDRFSVGSSLAVSEEGNYVLYESAGSPAFGMASVGGVTLNSMVIPADTTGMISADLNHDGVLDVILLRAGGVTPVFGAALAAFSPVAGGNVIAAAAKDLNGDSWVDLLVVTDTGTVEALYNKRYINGVAGANVFGAAIPVAGIGIEAITDIGIGDFNADGLNDFVIVGTNPPTRGFGLRSGFAQVFINTLAATPSAVGFAAADLPMGTWGFNSMAVEVFDADGNGRDDFAVANWGSKTVTIFLADALPGLIQDGRETVPDYCLPEDALKRDLVDVEFWLYKLELKCGYYPIALDSADLDKNGKADLVVALQSSSNSLDAQEPACIEVLFDVACGYHPEGPGVEAQLPHKAIQNVSGESEECVSCAGDDPCSDNTPPESYIKVEGEPGNP